MRHYLRWRFRNGKYDAYDWSKGKMFLLLNEGSDKWYTPRMIHNIVGVSLQTCRNQCRRLYHARPGYVKRRIVSEYDTHTWEYQLHPFCYTYQVSKRGQRWLDAALASGMPVNVMVDEIKAWQHRNDVVNAKVLPVAVSGPAIDGRVTLKIKNIKQV